MLGLGVARYSYYLTQIHQEMSSTLSTFSELFYRTMSPFNIQNKGFKRQFVFLRKEYGPMVSVSVQGAKDEILQVSLIRITGYPHLTSIHCFHLLGH